MSQDYIRHSLLLHQAGGPGQRLRYPMPGLADFRYGSGIGNIARFNARFLVAAGEARPTQAEARARSRLLIAAWPLFARFGSLFGTVQTRLYRGLCSLVGNAYLLFRSGLSGSVYATRRFLDGWHMFAHSSEWSEQGGGSLGLRPFRWAKEPAGQAQQRSRPFSRPRGILTKGSRSRPRKNKRVRFAVTEYFAEP